MRLLAPRVISKSRALNCLRRRANERAWRRWSLAARHTHRERGGRRVLIGGLGLPPLDRRLNLWTEEGRAEEKPRPPPSPPTLTPVSGPKFATPGPNYPCIFQDLGTC